VKTWKIQIPLFEEHERTPLADKLLELLKEQNRRMDILTDEIRRLKKLKTKPKLKPSKLRDSEKENKADKESNNTNQTQSSKKEHNSNNKKNTSPNRTEIVTVENIPTDARFKGYRHYHVQELVIRVENILYKLERWKLSDGSYVVAKLPAAVLNSHFGSVLKAYALHQHHHQCVTQPLLLAQLREWGVSISNGQLS